MKTRQPIGYVIADVEKTCWDERDPDKSVRQEELSEIIEIGAVWMRPDFTIEWDHPFQTCVKPWEHQTLSSFCLELTKITQEEVDEAPNFRGADTLFLGWMAERIGKGITIDEVAACEPVLVGWGSAEKTAFTRAAELAKIGYPFSDRYINLKEDYARWRRDRGGGKKKSGLKKAVEEMNFTFEGQQHRALPDAIMAARIMAAIRDPNSVTSEASIVLDVMKARAPKATNFSHLREALRATPGLTDRIRRGSPKQWWQAVLNELLRAGMIKPLPNGDYELTGR